MKRVIDATVASLGLIVTAPLAMLIAVLVRLDLGRPVLFRQERPGKDGQPFELIKFRTMRAGEGDDESRLTSFGELLRATSLDELPELWNVLRGDMSLVGPRPLLPEYLPLYTPEQQRRHEVRPGVTGLAQVRGRNLLDWESRFELDVWYVDNRTLWLDLKIMLETVWAVLTARGVSAADHVTIERFRGSEPLDDDAQAQLR